MSDKNSKYIIFGLAAICFYMIFFNQPENYYDNDQAGRGMQQVESVVDADAVGLNLQLVGSFLKKAKNGAELEKLLNDPNNAVNNLDLNQDGEVDFINVKEFGANGKNGFILSTKLQDNSVKELATITISKVDSNNASVDIKGNEAIYGSNHHYRSNWSGLGSILLMSYLFSPHPLYYSPWGWGYRPSYYNSYRRSTSSVYRNKNTQLRSKPSYKKIVNRKAALPNKSQRRFQSRDSNSSRVRSGGFGRGRVDNRGINSNRSLNSSGTTQRRFKSRDNSGNVRSGGFGRRTRSSSSFWGGSSRSIRSSSFGRSRGGFGFGK